MRSEETLKELLKPEFDKIGLSYTPEQLEQIVWLVNQLLILSTNNLKECLILKIKEM